jgi:hypothetical protein
MKLFKVLGLAFLPGTFLLMIGLGISSPQAAFAASVTRPMTTAQQTPTPTPEAGQEPDTPMGPTDQQIPATPEPEPDFTTPAPDAGQMPTTPRSPEAEQEPDTPMGPADQQIPATPEPEPDFTTPAPDAEEMPTTPRSPEAEQEPETPTFETESAPTTTDTSPRALW